MRRASLDFTLWTVVLYVDRTDGLVSRFTIRALPMEKFMKRMVNVILFISTEAKLLPTPASIFLAQSAEEVRGAPQLFEASLVGASQTRWCDDAPSLNPSHLNTVKEFLRCDFASPRESLGARMRGRRTV